MAMTDQKPRQIAVVARATSIESDGKVYSIFPFRDTSRPEYRLAHARQPGGSSLPVDDFLKPDTLRDDQVMATPAIMQRIFPDTCSPDPSAAAKQVHLAIDEANIRLTALLAHARRYGALNLADYLSNFLTTLCAIIREGRQAGATHLTLIFDFIDPE